MYAISFSRRKLLKENKLSTAKKLTKLCKKKPLDHSITLTNHLPVCNTSPLKTLWEKENFAHNEQFLLFPMCFLPFWRPLCHFHLI